MQSNHEGKLSDGWVLYYNEEGFPYYYKESTGESEWADYSYEENTSDERGWSTYLPESEVNYSIWLPLCLYIS